MDSVRASAPFWLLRTVSGFVLLAGFFAVVAAMITGRVVAASPARAVEHGEPAPDEEPDRGFRLLENAYVLTGGAGLGLFAFSFVVLAIWPNRTLEEQISQSQPVGLPDRSASASRGQRVYAREGCLNCHSQLVRFSADDVRRFGPPSQAWEARGDYPQLWGTRRIGPDLARIGPQVARLAIGPFVEPAACRARFGDARIPLALRRCANAAIASRARPGELP